MSGTMGLLENWDEERPNLISINLGGSTLRAFDTSTVESFLSKVKKELESWQRFQDELEKNGIIEYTGDSENPWVYGPSVRILEETQTQEDK